MIILLLYLTLCVFVMLDGVHTAIWVTIDIKETNPIQNWLITNYGIESMFAFKLIGLLVLGYLLYIYHQQEKEKIYVHPTQRRKYHPRPTT